MSLDRSGSDSATGGGRPGFLSRLLHFLAGRRAGAIICLHGLDLPSMPSSSAIHLRPDHLDELLRACAAVAELVPLPVLLSRHEIGKPTGGLVALTFDDAYASLLPTVPETSALLASLPRTIFAVADAKGPYWWDRLEHLQGAVSETRWLAFEERAGLPRSYRKELPEHGPITPMRQWILTEHKGRLPRPVEALVEELESDTATRTRQRPMTPEELSLMVRDPLVDVGVHTASHPVLPLLSADDVEFEIKRGYDVLRATITKALAALAIPYGLFDQRTVAIARRSGMKAVLTLQGKTLSCLRPDDPIPRFSVGNREPAWKLKLKISGLAERIPKPGADHRSLPVPRRNPPQ